MAVGSQMPLMPVIELGSGRITQLFPEPCADVDYRHADRTRAGKYLPSDVILILCGISMRISEERTSGQQRDDKRRRRL